MSMKSERDMALREAYDRIDDRRNGREEDRPPAESNGWTKADEALYDAGRVHAYHDALNTIYKLIKELRDKP